MAVIKRPKVPKVVKKVAKLPVVKKPVARAPAPKAPTRRPVAPRTISAGVAQQMQNWLAANPYTPYAPSAPSASSGPRLAPQVFNQGSRGQDARYDVSGLTQVRPGVYSDGVYEYDENGLSLSARPYQAISGLKPADEMDGANPWGMAGSVGGGGGGAGGGGGGGGIPGAPIFAQTAAEGLAQYKKALARLNQGRQNTMTQYGYAAEIDPESGALKNMRVDSSNPYGLYQGMRRGNAMSYEDLRDEGLARGFGSARGLGAQALGRARHQWGAADTAMAQALTSTLSGYDESQQDAHQSYQNLLWQLELEAARAAAEAANYGDYGGDEGGGDDGGGGELWLSPSGEFDHGFGNIDPYLAQKAKAAKKIVKKKTSKDIKTGKKRNAGGV